MAPRGVFIRGDTTVVGTADGLQITVDDGERWIAIVDTVGPAAKGPADTAFVALAREYVLGVQDDPIFMELRDRGVPLPAGWPDFAVSIVPESSPLVPASATPTAVLFALASSSLHAAAEKVASAATIIIRYINCCFIVSSWAMCGIRIRPHVT